MTTSCPVEKPLTGQTLFLGASIVSFNTNMGWGRNSSLTVELIEDTQPASCKRPVNNIAGTPISPFNNAINTDNHYHTCIGDACYVDEKGVAYNARTSKTKMVPGKIIYKIVNGVLVSNYWFDEDPGFFAVGTRVRPDGSVEPSNSNIRYVYDIIGIPVLFKLDNFSFGGTVTSWEKNISATGPTTYTVNIESFDRLLDTSYIIVDNYAGSIFSSFGPTSYGGPRNYFLTSNASIKNDGAIRYGNLHNVFNVYGFLESLSLDYFGGSNKNDDGISGQDIIKSLQVLTSTISNMNDPGATLGSPGNITSKRLYSPFGRLLTKTMCNTSIITRIVVNNEVTYTSTDTAVLIGQNFLTFGVIPPIAHTSPNSGGPVSRNFFTLDLSDIPNPPDSFRVSGNNGIISILDFIRQITDALGRDFFTVMVPTVVNNAFNCAIKVKTINRTIVPPQGQLASVVENLTNSGLQVTQSSYGKESNQNTSRVVYIGANQQRLLQVKNYRLGYSQTSYIYHPALKKFVNFRRFNSKGKIRMPLFISTRNPTLSIQVNGTRTAALWNDDESIAGVIRGDTSGTNFIDSNWRDNDSSGGNGLNILRGNYLTTTIDTRPDSPNSVRYIPLYEDTICPFFGYKLEDQIQIQTDDSSNIFRHIRPVWLDSWTGQIAVYFDANELPPLSIGSSVSLYDANVFDPPNNTQGATTGLTRGAPVSKQEQVPKKPPATTSSGNNSSSNPTNTNNAPQFGFLVTETEFRAAITSWDSYLTYCLGKSKSTKPDLFTILVNAYKAKGLFLDNRAPNTTGDVGSGLNRGGVKPPNTVGSAGQPSVARAPAKTKLDMNWDLFLNNDFIKDFKILTAFVASIGQKYYGRQYMVRTPDVRAYRDKEYTNSLSVPGYSNVLVFAGTGKIYYSYELADSAWEEYGNFIDDCIQVGDSKYYTLTDDRGMIPTILGYNGDDTIDYVRKKWCDVSFADRKRQLQDKIPPGTGVEDQQKQTLIANLISQNSFAAKTECGNMDNFYLPTLDLTKVQDYVEVELNNRTGNFANPWAEPHPLATHKSKKIYKKASSASMAFLDPSTFSGPRAIVSTEPIYIKDTSYAYASDPNLTVISNIALEDVIIYMKCKNVSGTTKPTFTTKEESFFKYMMSYITPVVDANKLVKEGNTSNQSASLQTISPKVAHPFFVGLPIKSNQYCYGPWSNYPFLDAINIFGPTVRATVVTENMIDNIKIEKKDEFAPWNFGGMSYLDKAVLSEIQDNTDYQSVLEMGSVTIQGTPIYEVGGSFAPLLSTIPSGARSPIPVIPTMGQTIIQNNSRYKISQTGLIFNDHKVTRPLLNVPNDYSMLAWPAPSVLNYNVLIVETDNNNAFLGPIISNMSMNVGANGINTTYSFRTFSRKTGIWNKENVDRIKKQNLNNIKFNKKISSSQNDTRTKIRQDIQNILDSSRDRSGPFSLAGFESKLFGSSPTEVLIGQSRPLIKSDDFNQVNKLLQGTGIRLGTAEPGKQNSQISNANSSSQPPNGLVLPYGKDPGDDATQHSLWIRNPISGVLSTKRFVSWVGMYMADEVGAELVKEYNTKAAMSLDGFFSPVSFYPTQYNSTYAMSSYSNSSGVFCPKCYGAGKITDTFVDPSNLNEREIEFACPVCSKGKPVVSGDGNINLYGLNPIVVPYGEFKNPNAQNSGNAVDRCRHSIQVVGRGEYNQVADQSFHIPSNLNKYVDPNTGYATNGTGSGVLADYYEYDVFKKKTENLSIQTQLNHRFFALRGPLMMHGWGYDTDGFPVPNAADEPKEIDSFGRPKRFIRKSDGTNDLEKDGAFLPTAGNVLGDIIGKGWAKSGGKWTKTRSNNFYLNWAERTDTWPVGPMDIRWDDSRKVWTASGGCNETLPPYVVASGTDNAVLSSFVGSKKTKCPYKMVYVTLEEDLVTEDGSDESYPSRGFLDDIQYAKTPLPAGARRVVYVKDRCGYSAPRGSKILCRYDGEYGFYEPVTKPNYIVFGTILGGNRAVLKLSYVQGRKRGEAIPTIQVAFDNTRFRFTINSRSSGSPTGMFLFENGKWILVAVN